MKRDVFQGREIDMIKQSRKFILVLINDLAVQQLNVIPVGFNNNIIWNVGHLIWAQQEVCYRRSGLKIQVEDKYFSPFRSGSKPDAFADEKEIIVIKQLLISTIDQFITDLENNVFIIDDAVSGLSFHDWLHAGYIMALKRLV